MHKDNSNNIDEMKKKNVGKVFDTKRQEEVYG